MAKNILICDDAAFMRMMIKDILTKNGYEIAGEAENGQKAVEKYNETKPDLVLMDITMPEMDGIQALKKIKEGDPNAIEFPKAKIGDCPYDFSFSGVKSAVLNYINHAQMTGEEINRADLAASFQKAVVDVLVEHTMLAAKDYKMTKIAIAGGVASNGTLRAAMEEACRKNNYSFYRPSPIFCTDNAAMIGVAAYYEYIKGTRHGWDLNAVPNLKLGER